MTQGIEKKWAVGQRVTTGPLDEPTVISKVTPTGIAVTEDGTRIAKNGRRLPASSSGKAWYRLATDDDDDTRRRYNAANAAWRELEDYATAIVQIQNSVRTMTYNSRVGGPDVPVQSAIDRAEKFCSLLKNWERKILK